MRNHQYGARSCLVKVRHDLVSPGCAAGFDGLELGEAVEFCGECLPPKPGDSSLLVSCLQDRAPSSLRGQQARSSCDGRLDSAASNGVRTDWDHGREHGK
ncbi:MAG: hypothetical protein JW940_36145 [Polyangiaceae bacterium]|nr:hypothetical protein [Polyangiaceae bacterium]